MPDHVHNVLSVVGHPDEIARFVAAARGKYPDNPDGQGRESEFCFHSLVPLPAEYSTNPYGDGSRRSGWNLEVETWGVKWGEYNAKPVVLRPWCVTYRFRTPWDGCHKMIGKAAPKWPALTFLLAWSGEGPCRGEAVFRGTERRVHAPRYTDEAWPSRTMTDDSDDDAIHDADDKFGEEFIRYQPLAVACEVARLRGMDFTDAPSEILADWLEENGCEELAAELRGYIAEATCLAH